MNAFQAAILGLVQGVTEFLPISSTAHLRIVPAIAGWDDPGAAFTAVLQLGTLAAVIVFFLGELVRMLRAALHALRAPSGTRPSIDARHLGYLIVGTIPIGVVGLLLRHAVEGAFRSLWVVAIALIVVALALAWIERRRATRRSRPGRHHPARRDPDRLCAGAGAGAGRVALGITLLAAMALGIRRDAAARFSFLLSIPAVGAAGIFELPKIIRAHDIGGTPLAVGLIVAALSGYASIAWLLKFLRTRSTMPFVIYRVALGVAIIAMLASGRLG